MMLYGGFLNCGIPTKTMSFNVLSWYASDVSGPIWIAGSRRKSTEAGAPNAWSGQKTTHIKPWGISTRSVHLDAM